jgi:hypothetical protein
MNHYPQLPSYDEQLLYDHLIACRKTESPQELLERFYALFVDGVEYEDADILASLYRVATARNASDHFKYVLNRSSRILMNYWWFQPGYRWAISELVYLLQMPPRRSAGHPAVHQLHQLVRQFHQTEECQALQRLAQVVEQGEGSTEDNPPPRPPIQTAQGTLSLSLASRKELYRKEFEAKPLRNLIHRYPYLYPHCLSGQVSSNTEFEAIRHLQIARQKKYERELARYTTEWVRQSTNTAQNPIAVQNPTLLSESQLRSAIKHFTGPIAGSSTYRDLARRFVAFSAQPQPYQSFKEGLHRYLITSIDNAEPSYSQHHFQDWLSSQLQNTLPQNDPQPVNSFLITRTCQQLIESLIAPPHQVGNHLMLVDLINNLGATVMTGLLLKLMLIYNNLKSAVEKQLSILYKHYEPVTNGTEWLVASLENVQLAFSLHYGSVQLPCLSQIV